MDVPHLDGPWYLEPPASDPPYCAIYQQDHILLFVNERGALATGRFVSSDTVIILTGEGWQDGLQGVVDRDSIRWKNGTVWRKGHN